MHVLCVCERFLEKTCSKWWFLVLNCCFWSIFQSWCQNRGAPLTWKQSEIQQNHTIEEGDCHFKAFYALRQSENTHRGALMAVSGVRIPTGVLAGSAKCCYRRQASASDPVLGEICTVYWVTPFGWLSAVATKESLWPFGLAAMWWTERLVACFACVVPDQRRCSQARVCTCACARAMEGWALVLAIALAGASAPHWYSKVTVLSCLPLKAGRPRTFMVL